MAYDEAQATRLRDQLADTEGILERRMFGGVAYMLNGHMTVGVSGTDIIVRVGADGYDDALTRPGTSTFGPGGRAMTGWVLVAAEAVATEAELAEWVQQAVGFTSALPPK